MVTSRKKTELAEFSCTADVNVGDLVSLDGEGKATTVTALTPDLLPALGVVISRYGDRVITQTMGTVRGVYQSLVPGERYLVGLDGKPGRTPFLAVEGTHAFFQAVGVAVDASSLLLTPTTTVVGVYL